MTAILNTSDGPQPYDTDGRTVGSFESVPVDDVTTPLLSRLIDAGVIVVLEDDPEVEQVEAPRPPRAPKAPRTPTQEG